MRLWLTVLGVVVLLLSGLPGVPAAAAPARSADDVAVGVIVDTTNPRSMQMAREAGFTHAKMIVHWPRLEPKKGNYAFANSDQNDLDNVMRAADAEDMKLVLRVDGAPDWAGGKPSKADPGAVESFYAAMAAHGKGTVAAYEILNEPNLPFEWGGDPSPSGYTAYLKAAYKGVKKGDPNALVIGGGLSPATGGAGGTIEDVDFLRGMYAAGAKGFMDAMAIHNYGGNHEPERDPGDCGICFRRAEIYRQVMVDAGDSATPVWATEFGWLMDPGKNMGQYDWMRVSADKQAEYVVRSFKYARQNWPWMTGLLLSNLDASTTPYHTGPQDGMPWFAILNKDYSPRPAWKEFKKWREGEGTVWATKPRATATPAAAATQVASTAPASGATSAATSGTPSSTADTAVAVASPTPDLGAVAAQPPATNSLTSDAVAAPPESVAAIPTTTLTPEPIPPAPPVATPSPSASATPAPTTASSSSATSTSARLKVARTEGTGANLRDKPSTDGKVVAILMDGTSVDVVGEDIKVGSVTWRNVRTVGSTTDGVTGWVSAQYLAP